MFLKHLLIKTNDDAPIIIRNIPFYKGLNLIIDNTNSNDKLQTGNSVGKTSVLRLIDFCLGAGKDVVYKAERREKVENTVVKNFLEQHKVSIELMLEYKEEKHVFSRSFAEINGENFWVDGEAVNSESEYKNRIESILYPQKPHKPSLRQLMSHHIRYQEPGMDSTLKTLHQTTKDSDYEMLYFYMLGINVDTSHDKIAKLKEDLKVEKRQLSKLTESHSRYDLELILESLDKSIKGLEKEKENFGLDKDTINDIRKLDEIKKQINQKSSKIQQLSIRLSVINDSIGIIEGEISNIDIESLKNIYEDTKLISGNVLHEFKDLVDYHNRLANNRKKYLSKQIPFLNESIDRLKIELSDLLKKESELRKLITRKDSYTLISDIISELSEKNRAKGQIENQLYWINETTKHIEKIEGEIKAIENDRKALNLKDLVSERVGEFNKEFKYISRELYGEEYALSFDDPAESKKNMCYSFKILSMDNFSTGKKQGEVICFDMSYILFCDNQNLPCMHFLLNDKKELLHNNPISKIAEFVSDKDIQLVFPILKDKIPEEVLKKSKVILNLSQNSKLFRIEEIDNKKGI